MQPNDRKTAIAREIITQIWPTYRASELQTADVEGP